MFDRLLDTAPLDPGDAAGSPTSSRRWPAPARRSSRAHRLLARPARRTGSSSTSSVRLLRQLPGRRPQPVHGAAARVSRRARPSRSACRPTRSAPRTARRRSRATACCRADRWCSRWRRSAPSCWRPAVHAGDRGCPGDGADPGDGGVHQPGRPTPDAVDDARARDRQRRRRAAITVAPSTRRRGDRRRDVRRGTADATVAATPGPRARPVVITVDAATTQPARPADRRGRERDLHRAVAAQRTAMNPATTERKRGR